MGGFAIGVVLLLAGKYKEGYRMSKLKKSVKKLTDLMSCMPTLKRHANAEGTIVAGFVGHTRVGFLYLGGAGRFDRDHVMWGEYAHGILVAHLRPEHADHHLRRELPMFTTKNIVYSVRGSKRMALSYCGEAPFAFAELLLIAVLRDLGEITAQEALDLLLKAENEYFVEMPAKERTVLL